MGRITSFIKEAKVELKKVSWPSREEVGRSTLIVFITVILFTLFIFFADRGINFLVQKVMD